MLFQQIQTTCGIYTLYINIPTNVLPTRNKDTIIIVGHIHVLLYFKKTTKKFWT